MQALTAYVRDMSIGTSHPLEHRPPQSSLKLDKTRMVGGQVISYDHKYINIYVYISMLITKLRVLQTLGGKGLPEVSDKSTVSTCLKVLVT